MRNLLVMALGSAALAADLAGQSLAARIDRVPEGTVRFAYPARPAVCGDGHRNITVRRHESDEWTRECDDGPVRIALDRAGGKTVSLRAYVGGQWRGGAAADLGEVPAAEAAAWLLALAERNEPASEKAVFPATLADGVEPWPALLRIARNDRVSRKTRKTATFWLGQAAGAAATRGLAAIVGDDRADREVRESAIFALSQQPRNEGVPALIRVARTNRDPRLRKTALFWLGESGDPAALALFEELLTQR
jgi:hypothetical protein